MTRTQKNLQILEIVQRQEGVLVDLRDIVLLHVPVQSTQIKDWYFSLHIFQHKVILQCLRILRKKLCSQYLEILKTSKDIL